MNDKVKVLDCTLRDGGYINKWRFGKQTIRNVVRALDDAKIDIIECGFIRDVICSDDLSVFNSMDQLSKMITPKSKGTLYAVMIEHHNKVYHKIPVYDGQGADIIRVTFRRNEWQEAKNYIRKIIEKGYKVCVQPVGTTNYDDESLLKLIRNVNELRPYAFYLVDTLGVMYRHDMRRFFYLIDNNLTKDICLGFHSHNNLQMSFANAQEMIRLANKRSIIIDSSCYGMGRGVGNLATELLCDQINSSIEQRYFITPIINNVDRYLMPIYAEQRWGYDLPYFLSGSSKCHPNYASYLIGRETLDIENIEKILSLLPIEARMEYNEELIERLYTDYQSSEINDENAAHELRDLIDGREVLILGSGSSIIREKCKIDRETTNRFVITANFITTEFVTNALFISNEKRLSSFEGRLPSCVIATSNLKIDKALVFNYSSLLGEGDAADNAGAMLIRILKKAKVEKIILAGFDGFDVNSTQNYAIREYQKSLDYETAKKKNSDIGRQLKLSLQGIDYEVLTKSKYEI